jgi:hypothetical protein
MDEVFLQAREAPDQWHIRFLYVTIGKSLQVAV